MANLGGQIVDKRNFIQKILGFCPQCGKYFRKVRTARQNTAYVDDTQNFFTGCKKCEEANDEYDFTESELKQIEELLSGEYDELWENMLP